MLAQRFLSCASVAGPKGPYVAGPCCMFHTAAQPVSAAVLSMLHLASSWISGMADMHAGDSRTAC